MADGLSVGSLSLSGGAARLTGTSSKLDTEAIVAAAYEASRLTAVRLEQRIARNEARGTALGELRTLLERLMVIAQVGIFAVISDLRRATADIYVTAQLAHHRARFFADRLSRVKEIVG